MPAIALPKGGGAIRGIGEKFAANPVTGTGSMTVPIATSPGRSGFGPQLSLSYDSGAGNGPFGFGWSFSLPSITRKTEKGLPKYQDAEESDVFILSGAEDLVPVLVEKNDQWVRETVPPRIVGGVTYRIQRYRPRIEGLFARIECWTNEQNPADVFWRSISKDNVTTWYGKTAESRIADPADPTRIFTWLICQTHDDKGNVLVYGYKQENPAGVDVSQAHERNRRDQFPSSQRYLKRIRYGNRTPYFPDLQPGTAWPEPSGANAQDVSQHWLFETVFDYDEPHYEEQDPDAQGRIFATGSPNVPQNASWPVRNDPFSTYRAGFEVRTYRLCQRVLMFHHFPDEPGVDKDCLVRSTDFNYEFEDDPKIARAPIYSFLTSVTQSGYVRQGDRYLKKSLPPVEFTYNRPEVQDLVEEVDPESVENLPIGLDGTAYQWTDLHGEGIPGILSEQGGAWFYKRNWSPIPDKLPDGSEVVRAKFSALETVALKPNVALSGGAQFMDLAGDGQPDLVMLDGPMPGLYEHDGAEGWETFRPFTSRLNHDMRDPNLKFVDLDGDGHSDVLITEDDAFVWHASLAEEGFGPARRVHQALDEEKGPRLVFADGTQSIYLADLSGDGLTDIVRIRNGEVCYWPNLGYGRFGAKVTMDNAPWFDHPDQFDHKRIRLADIDGTGTTDIIYLHRDGVRLYFNQSGNSWSQPRILNVFPRVNDLSSIVPTDLLGNGTACLVWSSPLPGDARRPMRFVNLMGRHKPHLLVMTINNLGTETRVEYAPSTKFYLQDKRDGNPWITRLPFSVHVVERVETYDHISRNRFVTRYAYHHGYFDGEEREFRGFGMVEQWDTEQFAAFGTSGDFPLGDNIDAASHVPPVHTRTWFHIGVYLDREHISRQFEHEYYREPGLSGDAFRALLLPDTHLPDGLTLEEEREACRALKGSMLRQEVYADDAEHPGATPEQVQRARTPYTVTEQDFSIRTLQPRGKNRHAVFFTHAREAISYHYERNPADPRIQHALTLEIDAFGNVLKQAAIGYGRRVSPLSTQWDRDRQTAPLLTYTENRVTNAIESSDTHRNPLPCQAVTFELTGYTPTGPAGRYQGSDFVEPDPATPGRLRHKFTDQVAYEAAATGNPCRRPIEWLRTLYRRDDLSGLLRLGEVHPLSLPGESYKLAFTPGLLAQVFQRPRAGQPPEPLLPDPAAVLGGQAGNRGGYLQSQTLKADGRFPASDADDHWWIPSGQTFFTENPADPAAVELAQARQHFFLPRRYRDPFGQDAFVDFDANDLLMVETRDALGNRVTVNANDYRVLQPRLVSDPNRNQTEVAFDTLGMVVGTAVMGKPLPAPVEGDTLAGFIADLTQGQLDGFFDPADPHGTAQALLQSATTRIVYDLDRFRRTQQAHPTDPTQWQPACAATLARETHISAPLPPQGLKIQLSFSYSDGFGREVQKKIQAEPETVNGVVGPPRWVGSGWTIFNNKGKPVRRYEPFFSATHRFEFGVQVGVSPILFYDPVERVVATLHPNHTYEKVVFDPWQQTTYDVNDTVLGDPRTDADIRGYTAGYFASLPASPPAPTWQTWHAQRQGGALGAPEQSAASKAAAHADTPTTAHFDTLGRLFLTLADNGPDPAQPGQHLLFATRVELDIEGNQRAVRDAIEQAGDKQGRVVMRYAYDMLGNRIHQLSMEARARWMLNDVAGKSLYAWDSRNHQFRTAYDPLRRPTESFLREGTGAELLVERSVYGETRPNPETNNLRGMVVQLFDQAGIVTSVAYDFKGNLLEGRRQLAQEYKAMLNWSIIVPLESDTYNSRTTYDALNRPLTATSPDGSVYRPTFNEANLLDKVDVNLRGVAAATPFVKNIDYDAKGQRGLIEYGNGVRTKYEYDKDTFRLIQLKTSRNSDSVTLQDLSYTYDPVGNITSIEDKAQQRIFFDNECVMPIMSYAYDATYRLVHATGREHIGQVGKPTWSTWDDAARIGLPHPNECAAMRNYTEDYNYDAVGNFLSLVHVANNGNWTRSYTYSEPSLIEPGKKNNRLSSTTVGNNNPITERYIHDAHGNMIRMPHLGGAHPSPNMHWGYRDQLRQTDLGGGGTAYYVYDAAGQRVRKVWEKSATLIKERIYLGGFEIFRRHGGAIGANTATLERETLHLMDDKQRIALVETRTLDTAGNDPAPPQLIRYQFVNHLGSASLELDDKAQIISYEEYTPYGSSSFQATRSLTETAKRYRYTGKERDEESGLYYHGARYYSAWLGRWASCDPANLVDGPNLYRFVRCNPIRLVDRNGNDSSVGPLQLRNPQFKLNGSATFSLQLTDLFSEDRSMTVDAASLAGRVGFTAGARLPAFNLDGTATGQLSLDATIQNQRLSASLSGSARFDVGPANLGVKFDVNGSTQLPTRIPLSADGLGTLRATALQNLRGDVHANAELRLGRFTLGTAAFNAEVGSDGKGTTEASGRLILPSPSGNSGLTLGRFSGAGTISPEGYNLAGNFSALTPIGGAVGTWSLDSKNGFAGSGHYFGLQLGPLALTPDAKDLAQQLASARRRPNPHAITSVFDPGASIGYSNFSYSATGSSVFSIGVAPRASDLHYSPAQPPLPFPASTLEPRLYGRKTSLPAGFYIGASLSGRF